MLRKSSVKRSRCNEMAAHLNELTERSICDQLTTVNAPWPEQAVRILDAGHDAQSAAQRRARAVGCHTAAASCSGHGRRTAGAAWNRGSAGTRLAPGSRTTAQLQPINPDV